MGRRPTSSLCHRDKERIRHQMLNRTLDHVSNITPGQSKKETKTLKLKRIISYVAFLHKTRAKFTSLHSGKKCLANRIEVDLKKNFAPVKNTKVSTTSKPGKAEIVFLSRQIQKSPHSPENELSPIKYSYTLPSNSSYLKDGQDPLNQDQAYPNWTKADDYNPSGSSSEPTSLTDSQYSATSATSSSTNDQAVATDDIMDNNIIDFDFDLPFMDIPNETNVSKGLENKLVDDFSSVTDYDGITPLMPNIPVAIDPSEMKPGAHFDSAQSSLSGDNQNVSGSENYDLKSLENNFNMHHDSNSESAKNHVDISESNEKTPMCSSTAIVEVSKLGKDEGVSDEVDAVDSGATDDQIVPHFLNLFNNAHEENDSANHKGKSAGSDGFLKKSVRKPDDVKFDKEKLNRNTDKCTSLSENTSFKELHTYTSSEIVEIKPEKSENGTSKVNLPVLTEIRNRSPNNFSVKDKSEFGSYKMHSPNEEHNYHMSFKKDTSQNDLMFYQNYFFPPPEQSYFQNSALQPINAWLPHMGNVMAHAYPENMLFYQNFGHMNYPNLSYFNSEAELCKQNVLISHNSDINNSDVMHDLIDARKRPINDTPFNASHFSILNDTENQAESELRNAVPESSLTSNNELHLATPKTNPYLAYSYEDNCVRILNVKQEELIDKEIEKPSLDEKVDIDKLFVSKAKGKGGRRKRRKALFVSKRRTTKMQNNSCEKISVSKKKSVPNEYQEDQVVPGGNINLNSHPIHNGSMKTTKYLKTGMQNQNPDFNHFDEMENSFLSFDSYRARNPYASNHFGLIPSGFPSNEVKTSGVEIHNAYHESFESQPSAMEYMMPAAVNMPYFVKPELQLQPLYNETCQVKLEIL